MSTADTEERYEITAAGIAALGLHAVEHYRHNSEFAQHDILLTMEKFFRDIIALEHGNDGEDR